MSKEKPHFGGFNANSSLKQSSNVKEDLLNISKENEAADNHSFAHHKNVVTFQELKPNEESKSEEDGSSPK